MKRISTLLTLTAALVAGCSNTDSPQRAANLSSQPAASSAADNQAPNIVFIMLDDWGWQDVGYNGSDYYQTPHIDKLASQSYQFNQAYSSSPNCAPTRAAFMSGQYPQRTGIYTVNSSERGKSEKRRVIPTKNSKVLSEDVITLGESMQKAGYHTAFMGKWHLGAGEDGGPLEQGFDVNVAGNHTGTPKSYFSPYKNSTIKNGPDGEYLPDRLSREAADYIKTDHGKPFFLFLSHYAVHTPMKAPKESIAKHKDRKGDKYHNHPIYAAMLEHSDNSVANVLKALEEKGVMDNTWVFLTSDNGGHSGVTQAPDLRGAKGMMYEGGVRVPLLIKAPKQQQQVMIEEPVSTLDFYPTLVSLAKAQLPSTQAVDGTDITPLFDGEPLEREAIFFHFPAYLEGGKKGKKSKALWRNTPSSMVRMGDYKLIEFFEYGQIELYNLKKDQKETTNLALKEPKVTQALYQKLKDWQKKTKAPLPTKLNPKFDKKYELKPDDYITWAQVEQQLQRQYLTRK